MGGFSGALGNLYVAIQGDTSDLSAKLDEVVAEAEKTGQELSRLDIAAGMAANINTQIDGIKEKFSGLQAVGTQLAGLGAGLTAGITVPLTALATLSVQAASDMDSLNRGLTAVAGSSDAAAQQMTRLQEVAKLPGLGLEEAVKGSIALQAVGTSATDAERYLTAFGNALATVGKGKADLEGVVTQLVQMSAKSKVVAEDIKPIMERVPQVATIIKDAYGTIDTEVIQKMGVGSQQMINTIVTGLEKLPPVSGGIKNAMENVGDSFNRVLVTIGNLFIPVLEKVMPMLETLLGWAKSAAEWFGGLPTPIQAAVGTIAALAAALGPLLVTIGGITAALATLMPALTALAGFFGVSVGALAPWALAIGAVLAALVALGVWVAENWDPIVATLKQAWEGFSEAWGAVWGTIQNTLTGAWNAISGAVQTVWEPIGAFFATIWSAIAPYFTTAWEGIKSALTGIWNGIKDTAATVWNGIIAALQSFLDFAEKIPGVKKLLNLDEAWKSAEKLKTKVNDAGTAVEKFGGKAKDAAGSPSAPIPKLGKATKEAGDNAKTSGTQMDDLGEKTEKLTAKQVKQWEAAQKQAQEFAAAKQKLSELTNEESMMLQPTESLNQAIQAQTTAMNDLATLKIPSVIGEMKQFNTETNNLNTALGNLGVKSATEYNTVATNAKTAYDAVMGSGIATDWEKDNALLKMLEAQKAAAIANSTAVPEEVQNQIDAIKGKLENTSTGVPALKQPWEALSTDISNIIGNTVHDMAMSLFEGDFSFGEKMKGMLKSIGTAVVDSFITPATTALTGFINGVLKDLLTDLGKSVGLFKEAGTEAAKMAVKTPGGDFGDEVSGVPSVPGGGGGSSAASGLSGFLSGGLFGNILAAGQLGMSVFQSFQFAAMNKSLDLIENYTRYLKIAVWEQADSIWKSTKGLWEMASNAEKNYWGVTVAYFQDWSEKFDTVIGKLDLAEQLKPLKEVMETVRDDVRYVRDAVWEARDYLGNASERLIEIAGAVGQMNTRDQNRAMNPPAANWTVTFSGDPIAKLVGDQIMQQLRMQGVNLVPGVSR